MQQWFVDDEGISVDTDLMVLEWKFFIQKKSNISHAQVYLRECLIASVDNSNYTVPTSEIYIPVAHITTFFWPTASYKTTEKKTMRQLQTKVKLFNWFLTWKENKKTC